jgi:hypothetical protein
MSDNPKYVIIVDKTGYELKPGDEYVSPILGVPVRFHGWRETADGRLLVDISELDGSAKRARVPAAIGLHAATPIPISKRDSSPSDYEKLLAGHTNAVTEGLREDYQKLIGEALVQAEAEKSETKPTQVTLYVVDERGWVNTKTVEISPEHSIDHIDVSVDGVGLARLYPTTRSDK